jgi:hypothetical protein
MSDPKDENIDPFVDAANKYYIKGDYSALKGPNNLGYTGIRFWGSDADGNLDADKSIGLLIDENRRLQQRITELEAELKALKEGKDDE